MIWQYTESSMANSKAQKIEELKRNKGNFTFPTHTINVIELQSNRKVATFHFYINATPHPPHFSESSPLSNKNLGTHPK